MDRGGKNPVFRSVERNIEDVQGYGASYKGIIAKTGILLLVAIVSGFASLFLAGVNPTIFYVLLAISSVMGFISVIVASVSTRLAPTFSIIYAVCEGVVLGVLTLSYGAMFGGANFVWLAVLITIGIFIAMLVLYSTKLIVATSRFRRVMMGISFSLISVMLIVGLVSLFDDGAMSYMLFGNPNSPLVLLLSLLLIAYGAFMLVINFDNASMIVSSGADKKYEWTVSLGLIISIIYIYVQVLRLLAILAARSQD